MSRFNAIDLGALAPPDVIEALDYETVLAALKADMVEALSAILPDWDSSLESDAIVKLLEQFAYREILLRSRVNDAARAVMLSTATGADLDAIAARYHVARFTIVEADDTARPPVEAVMEDDADLRERVLLAFEALSVAGPSGAYLSATLNADARVSSVAVTSPEPGEVVVTVLSTEGDGIADADLLDAVSAALNDEDTRPLTDHVTVQAGTRIDYAINAELTIYDGPAADVVRTASEEAVTAFAAGQRRLGEPVTIDGLHKALRVDGVKKVSLIEPAADVEPLEAEFAHCTGIAVAIAGAS